MLNPTTVVFIDSRVQELQSIVFGLAADTTWILLDTSSGGLEQIAAAMSGLTGLQSVQLISHGSPGTLLLGSSLVTEETLRTRSDLLAKIGAALAPDSDLLLYGCNVAEGDSGLRFISLLSELVGADVAASTNLTGALASGGDSSLEASTGLIETSAIDLQALNTSLELITGTAGNDTLLGTEFDDQMFGLGGADRITAEASNDSLDGGEGNDTLDGSVGNDTLLGGPGNDSLIDGQGSNLGDGGDGDDRIEFAVLEGNNTLLGGLGNDSLRSEGVSSVLDGGADNDLLQVYGSRVWRAQATLTGGTGDDRLEAWQHKTASLSGGAGNDSLTLHFASNATLEGGAGNDSLYAVVLTTENHRFGEQAAAVSHLLDGGEGNDDVRVDATPYPWFGTTSLTLLGGSGDDSVGVTATSEWVRYQRVGLSGGDGNDTLYADSTLQLTMTGGLGSDTYALKADQYRTVLAGPVTLDAAQSYDPSTGWTTTSRVTVSPEPTEITDFAAGVGGDVLDIRDLLLNAALNYDYSNPFASGHLQLVQSGTDTLVRFDADGSASSANGAVSIAVLRNTSAANLIATNFSPSFSPLGGPIPGVTINGTAGADSLNGLDGGDLVQGMAGNDTLDGGFGDDTLDAGDGADTLRDNFGSNTLLGGLGNDSLRSEGVSSVLDGGADNDLLQVYGSRVWRAQATLTGGTGDDRLEAWQHKTASLSGGAGNDSLTLHFASNATLEGGAGNDSLYAVVLTTENHRFGEQAAAVSHLLDGGEGNDDVRVDATPYPWFGTTSLTLLGGSGDDSVGVTATSEWVRYQRVGLSGGDGNDTLYADSTLQLTMTGGLGSDTYALKADQYRTVLAGPVTLDAAQSYDPSTGWTTTSRVTVSPEPTEITDFAAGVGGDVLDIRDLLLNAALNYAGTNPFGSGHLMLEQVGPDVHLRFDLDGRDRTDSTPITIAILNDVNMASLKPWNFNPKFRLDGRENRFEVDEGEVNPQGMTIESLVQTSDILGPSGQPVQAIALERLDSRLGTWQYRLDGNATWLTIDSSLINRETNTLGLLLRAQDSIRLLPFGDLNGDVASGLTFRAWDNSTGFAGNYILTTPGAGAFGSATDSLALRVNPVNDAPDFVFSNGLSSRGASLGDETAYAIAQLPDGRLIVAGVVEAGPGSYFSLMRLNLDGTLDTSFGAQGKALVAMALNDENRAHDLIIQPDGKILVGGASGSGSDWTFSIARLTANGNLDPIFGSAGIARTAIGNGNHAGILSLQLQPDGKILASGYSNIDGAWKATVARYLANGILDTSFDLDGTVAVQTRTGDEGGLAALRDDGKITVIGNNPSALVMARLNADGSYDTAFDGDGRMQLASASAGLFAAATQADGDVVAVGSIYGGADWKVSVYRVNTAGGLDTSFGSNGRVLLDWESGDDFGQNIAIQADGKILIAGYSRTSKNSGAPFYEGKYDTRLMQDAVLGVMRLNQDGSLDTSFDGDGRLMLPVGTQSFAFDLLVQADGKIALAGAFTDAERDRVMVIRLNADGSLDQEFGGEQATSLNASPVYTENAAPIILDPTARVSDPELAALNDGAGNYAGASLVLSRIGGADPSDLFSASGNVRFQADAVLISDLRVGDLSKSNGALTILFNQNATQANVNQVLSSLSYANASEAPSVSAQIGWQLIDGNLGAQGTGGSLAGIGVTTVAIRGVNDLPVGEVSITGPTRLGSTLSVTNTLQDADGFAPGPSGSIRYQWHADGLPITGATADQYTIVETDRGKTLTVTASYQDGLGVFESVSSVPTSRIQAEHFAYHWKSHVLLQGLEVVSVDAQAVVPASELLDLRAATYDPGTRALTVQLWANPNIPSADLDFRISATGMEAASFISALPSSWSIVENTETSGAFRVAGFDTSTVGFSTATHLGTLTIRFAPGTRDATATFVETSIGGRSAEPKALRLTAEMSDAQGRWLLDDRGTEPFALTLLRSASDSGNAITAADALAAMRIAVNLNPNPDPDGTGPLLPLPVSPYQIMAADVNGSGSVTSADALAILRMAVRQSVAAPQEWLFVEETRDLWDEVAQQSSLTRASAQWDRTLLLEGLSGSQVNFVGVLKGDVNGSWSAPAGSVDLDSIDPFYFDALAARLGASVTQWGF